MEWVIPTFCSQKFGAHFEHDCFTMTLCPNPLSCSSNLSLWHQHQPNCSCIFQEINDQILFLCLIDLVLCAPSPLLCLKIAGHPLSWFLLFLHSSSTALFLKDKSGHMYTARAYMCLLIAFPLSSRESEWGK